MKTELIKSENENLVKEGFQGWKTVKELRESCCCIPTDKGVYMVLRALSDEMPEFLEKGTGGLHKGADLNYSVSDLVSNWVENASIMYIGKTDSSLRTRIRTYINHGMGKDAAHRGGRSIWQLPDAADLVFIWLPIDKTDDARSREIKLIGDFQTEHGGRMPFANKTR